MKKLILLFLITLVIYSCSSTQDKRNLEDLVSDTPALWELFNNTEYKIQFPGKPTEDNRIQNGLEVTFVYYVQITKDDTIVFSIQKVKIENLNMENNCYNSPTCIPKYFESAVEEALNISDFVLVDKMEIKYGKNYSSQIIKMKIKDKDISSLVKIYFTDSTNYTLQLAGSSNLWNEELSKQFFDSFIILD